MSALLVPSKAVFASFRHAWAALSRLTGLLKRIHFGVSVKTSPENVLTGILVMGYMISIAAFKTSPTISFLKIW